MIRKPLREIHRDILHLLETHDWVTTSQIYAAGGYQKESMRRMRELRDRTYGGYVIDERPYGMADSQYHLVRADEERPVQDGLFDVV